ncbi:MAG: hypothetical protein AB2A00_07765 [Myxococcota bacterium]
MSRRPVPHLALALVITSTFLACRGASPRAEAPKHEAEPRPSTAGARPRFPEGEGVGITRLREKVATQRPGSAEAFFWQAVTALHVRNDVDTADSLIRQALRADPSHPRSLLFHCTLAHHLAQRGDVLERCALVVERAPSSWEAEVALALMAQTRGLHPAYSGRMATAAVRGVDGCPQQGGRGCAELAAAAMTHVLAIAGQAKDVSLHQSALSRGGSITAWTVAGPYAVPEVDAFRALAGLGASGIPPDAPAPLPAGGLFTRSLRLAPDGVLRPARYATPGIYVAHADVHLARPSRFLLDLRTSASVRAYVDGVLLVTQDRWASSATTRATATAVAAPGWHRVSLELAVLDRDAVEVRLLSENGLAPMDIQSAQLPDGTAFSPAATRAPPLPNAVTALEQQHASDPADVEAGLGAVWLHGGLPRRHPSAARALAEQLANEFPGSAVVQQTLAQALEQDHGLPGATRSAAARLAYQAALQRSSRLSTARHRLAVLSQSSRPDEAQDILQDVVKAQPEHATAWRSLFELYRNRGWNAEAAQALDQALELGAPDRLLEEGASFFRALGDVPRARELRKRWAASEDNLFSARTAQWRAEELDDAGALEEWQRLLRIHPDHPDQGDRLQILERTGDNNALRAALDAHLERFPADGEALQQLCTTQRALGDQRGLRGCLERVRTLSPSSIFPDRVDAELSGVELGDDVPVPDARALIDQLLAAEAAGDELLRGHPTVVVLDAMRRVLKRSGGGFVVQHRLVRVGTREAADEMGELSFDAGDERRIVRVWKANGRVVEPEAGQGKAEVSMSALSPGDFLETRTVSAIQTHTPEGNFLETFFLAGNDPVLLAEYVVEAPEEVVQELRMFPRGAPAPVVTRRDGVMRAVWRAERIPAIQAEPFSAPPVEYAPRVMVALRPDPLFDARRECRRMASTAQPTPELVALAEQLKRGARDVSELVSAVLDHVRATVEPANDPVDASEVLAGGRGHHLSLVRALLRLGGVRARIVIARSALGPQVEMVTPRSHDVSILVVPTGTGDILLSGVGPWLLEGPVPPNLASHDAVEADCDEVGRLGQTYPLPPPDENVWENRSLLEVALGTGGDVTGTLTATFVGPLGPMLRQAVGQATAAQLQQWAGSILLESFPGVQVKGVSTSDVAARSGPFELKVRFTAPAVARSAGDVMLWDRVVEKPMLRGVVGGLAPEEYLRVGTRQTPLLLSRPLRERMVLRVVMPLGSQVVRGPRSFRVDGPGFAVAQNVVINGSTMELTRSTRVDVARIQPGDYAEFRGRVEQAVQKGRNRLEFRTGTATSRP